MSDEPKHAYGQVLIDKSTYDAAVDPLSMVAREVRNVLAKAPEVFDSITVTLHITGDLSETPFGAVQAGFDRWLDEMFKRYLELCKRYVEL